MTDQKEITMDCIGEVLITILSSQTQEESRMDTQKILTELGESLEIKRGGIWSLLIDFCFIFVLLIRSSHV